MVVGLGLTPLSGEGRCVSRPTAGQPVLILGDGKDPTREQGLLGPGLVLAQYWHSTKSGTMHHFCCILLAKPRVSVGEIDSTI